MRLSVSVLAVGLALSALPLSAQEPGTIEVGGFGQATWFDELTSLSDATAFGGGGLLGIFVSRNLALEIVAARGWTEDASPAGVDGVWAPFRGRFVYNIPATDRIYPMVGLGLVRNDYNDFFGTDENDWGFGPLVGFKAYLTDRMAFRSDLSMDQVWSAFNEGDMVGGTTVASHTNWTATAGLSFDLGPGRSRDSDGDGVRDRDDVCPATPMNVRVDARGCRIDSDGDGVFDEDDDCANTTSGVRVDDAGCRVDTDGDGVFDEDDRCADTTSGVRVDNSGCRVDTDGDGVFDEDDRCANTPDGARVDGGGCRVDTDGDGVFDEDDRCTNSPLGSEVDASGCPVLFEDAGTVVLEGVTFETNSAELTGAARTILDRVATALVGNAEISVRVNGHTDSTGSRQYNVDLSQSRAESVVAYLASRGVARGRMEARGVGPDEPVANNDTDAGRRMNRRVELERIN